MKLNLHEDTIEQCLFDALIELLQTTSIDNITVNQILKKARVGHSTFYRRYKDKYDLLNLSYKKLMKNTIFKVSEGGNWRELTITIYSVLKQNHKVLANALYSKDPNSLKNLIFDESYHLHIRLLTQNGEDMDDWVNIIRLRAYIWGNLEITCNWLLEGAKDPVEKLTDVLIDGIPFQFKKYFV